MRVSLTLKPNSRPDFGFQAHWDSTGVRVKFIQPGKHRGTFKSWVSEFLTHQHCVLLLAQLTELKMCKKKMWPFSCFIVRRVDDKWQERQSYAELTIVFSSLCFSESGKLFLHLTRGLRGNSRHWQVSALMEADKLSWQRRTKKKKEGITETVQRVETEASCVAGRERNVTFRLNPISPFAPSDLDLSLLWIPVQISVKCW